MPSDVEDRVRQGQDRLQQILPRGGARGVIALAAPAPPGLDAWTIFDTVSSDPVAVVQRFGRYLEDVPPGVQFEPPLAIDAANIVPVERQLKQEFGFMTPGARDPHQGSRARDGMQETQVATGDPNAALFEWVARYRISDPVELLFRLVSRAKSSAMSPNPSCGKSWAIAGWTRGLPSPDRRSK